MIEKRRSCLLVMGAGLVGLALAGWILWPLSTDVPDRFVKADRQPQMSPDYGGCVIPPNIAPLNFVVREAGTSYCVAIRGEQGPPLVVRGSKAAIEIPLAPWRELIDANRGRSVFVDIYAEQEGGRWRRFDPVRIQVAAEDIDPYVVYRLLGPLHNVYQRMGTYQRNIESYDEAPLVESDHGDRCMNCHTFVLNKPDRMVIHMRGKDGVAMLLVEDGKTQKIDTRTVHNSSPAAYSAWHPSGKFLAYSMNKLSLLHRTTGQSREVFEHAADLGVYVVESNRVISTPKISSPDELETFPTWSPDGKFLYFSSAPRRWAQDTDKIHAVPPAYDKVRYSLKRIAFDIEKATWGELETVLEASEAGKTLLEPRVSPDGRFLLFCAADYGNFPVYMESSDLYLMDLATKKYWPLAANSERTDSWHSWSSNGRWVVFASKRENGLLARLYLTYIDADGKSHKPVLLPQRSPEFYESFLKTYNAPEMVSGRVTAGNLSQAARASVQQRQVDVISGASATGEDPPALEPVDSGEYQRF